MNNISVCLMGENGTVNISHGIFDIKHIGIEMSRISQVCHCEAEEDEIAIRIPIILNSALSNAKLYNVVMNLGKISRIFFMENSSVIIDVIPQWGVTTHSFLKDGENITSVNFIMTRNLLFSKGGDVNA